MEIKEYIKGTNAEMKGGILCLDSGNFEAFTMTQAKKYKTLRGAVNFLTRNGYIPAPAEVIEEPQVEEVKEVEEVPAEEIVEEMGFLVQVKRGHEEVEKLEEVFKYMKTNNIDGSELFEGLIESMKKLAGVWVVHTGKLKEEPAREFYRDAVRLNPHNSYRLLRCKIQFGKDSGLIVLGQQPKVFEVLEEHEPTTASSPLKCAIKPTF